MKRETRFRRGSGCYTCKACGKKTRATGEGEEWVELCARCYEKAGDENSLADGVITIAEFNAKWPEDAKLRVSAIGEPEEPKLRPSAWKR